MAPKKIEHFELRINHENAGRFIDLCNKIQSQIDVDEPVPASLAKEFFELFVDDETEIDPLTLDATKISEKAVKKITRTRGYDFNARLSIIPPFKADSHGKLINSPAFIIVDLQKLFYDCVLAYLKFYEKNPIITKQIIIQMLYSYLNSYIKKFDSKSQLKFTKYRKAVITGVLVEAVGFKLSNKKLRSNHKIFLAVKHYVVNTN